MYDGWKTAGVCTMKKFKQLFLCRFNNQINYVTSSTGYLSHDHIVFVQIPLKHRRHPSHAIHHPQFHVFPMLVKRRGLPVHHLYALVVRAEKTGPPGTGRFFGQSIQHLRARPIPNEHRVHRHPQLTCSFQFFAHKTIPRRGLAIGDEQDVLVRTDGRVGCPR
jgi:hypothetical protein